MLTSRFWDKVHKTSTCWLWTAATNKDTGYGVFNVGNHRTAHAHKLAYLNLVGPVPPGLEIDHVCRVRRCVNPAHMQAVTHRTNDLRGTSIMAENARKTHCVHGHPFAGDNLRVRVRVTRGRILEERVCVTCNKRIAAESQRRRIARRRRQGVTSGG